MNRWSSHIGFIMAATGAAVGLGAIWKFPYMAGQNGGGAFVLVYILAVIFIGVPVMIGEIVLGRLGRENPVSSLKKLALKANHSTAWQYLGWWGALALLLVLSFYSVVAGWSIAYIFKTWTWQLSTLSPNEIINTWDNFLSNPLELLLWHTIFMLLTLGVVARGVQSGLEKASHIMMPGLFLVLVILTAYSSYVGDISKALKFLFYPDFAKLTPAVVIDALGQAAFSLAVGAGCMLVYGCYIPEKNKIAGNVCLIASLVILVSIISGITIFPLVFAYELSPEGGPGLMFKVLPIAFNQMPGGTWFGGLFFLMLWFAAWTSSISMAEPLVVILKEHFNFSRIKSSCIIGLCSWTIGATAMLSFNVLQNVKLFNHYSLFSAITDLTTNILLPVGVLGFAIFAGWLMPKNIISPDVLQISNATVFKIWRFSIRIIAPIAILIILLKI